MRILARQLSGSAVYRYRFFAIPWYDNEPDFEREGAPVFLSVMSYEDYLMGGVT